jgi:hypothetical protein
MIALQAKHNKKNASKLSHTCNALYLRTNMFQTLFDPGRQSPTRVPGEHIPTLTLALLQMIVDIETLDVFQGATFF